MLLLLDSTTAAPVVQQATSGSSAPIWNIRLPWNIERRTVRRHVSTPASGGAVHRRQANSSHSPNATQRREWIEWTVSWPWMSEDEADQLRTLWQQTHAGVTPFLWNPDEVSGASLIPANFIGDSLVIRRISGNSFTASVQVREAF